MDRLKGFGTSLVGAAVDKVEKSGWGDRISKFKENHLNEIYDIGNRRFAVKKLIAEGGFGFVFLVKDVATERQYALKRILVQDRERVPAMKNEVNLMKALARQPHVVCLEDHKIVDNRTELEVLLLMEYCSCSLLDAMNQGRLHNEQAIYDTFSQICSAVARLHSNNPPISHRDLKVENVLLGEDGKWKLCDFGSATTATYLPTNERERSVAEEDINRNTTMMYRAPEMVDLYRRQPINEKVDIWALGCVLFKMAYLVDAFDGGLGIMNARYTFPEYRRTSATFEEFIKYLLNPDPTARPNIQQVQERLAALRGVPAPKQPASVSPRVSGSPNIALSSPSQHNSSRPSPAPVQKPVADLLDWGEESKPTPKPTLASNPSPTPLPQPSKPASNALFDTLDWQHTPSTAPTAKPTTVGPKPNSQLNSTSQTSQRPTRTNASTKQADQPDLLDFSDPTPKPNPAIAKHVGPPTATPAQYYSPQQPRTHNSYFNGPPTYYSPPFTHQAHQQQSNHDILAQFTLAKPPSSGGLDDDFDPLAKKTSSAPSVISPSSTPQLPPPKASLKPHAARSDPNDLISF